jgi:hypothetical protein
MKNFAILYNFNSSVVCGGATAKINKYSHTSLETGLSVFFFCSKAPDNGIVCYVVVLTVLISVRESTLKRLDIDWLLLQTLAVKFCK